MPKLHIIVLSFAGLLLFGAQTHAAEDEDGELYSPLSTLYGCASITEPTQRLACYDAKVAKLRTAEEKQEIVAIDAKAARKIKREAFGFNLPSLSKIGLPKISLPGGKSDKADALTAEVKSVRKSGRVLLITLKNGQIWKQVGGRLNYVPKGDLTATIKPKSVGSFMLSLNNGKTTVRGLRVRRVE
ncbi:MAG: hypothetical protein L3J65_03160 [Robiginitomaculum sp.]|nr:hypothetical protein [Robiginitomaculum sp.]